MSSAKITTNHDEIRNWVEKRGGHPAVVKSTENKGQPGGLLRIDYDEPGGNDDTRLHRISWDEIFKITSSLLSRSMPRWSSSRGAMSPPRCATSLWRREQR